VNLQTIFRVKHLFIYICNYTLNINTKNYKKMAIHVTDADFEEVVLKSDVPVLVDFWAEWCGPCKMIGPIVEELSVEYEGRAKMVKVDVDNNSGTSMNYGIRNIPTLLFFKGGEIVDKQVGVVAKAALAEKIDKLL